MEQIEEGLDLIWLLFVITHVGQKCLLWVIAGGRMTRRIRVQGCFLFACGFVCLLAFRMVLIVGGVVAFLSGKIKVMNISVVNLKTMVIMDLSCFGFHLLGQRVHGVCHNGGQRINRILRSVWIWETTLIPISYQKENCSRRLKTGSLESFLICFT